MPLTMPLFVKPADVILRMQLSPDLTGIDEVITSGIIGAQLHVQRIVGGYLTHRIQDALFFVDTESFSGIAPNGAYRLEIPSGFVRSDVPVIITASQPRARPFEEFFDVDMSLVRIEAPRGYVHLDANQYGDCHVRVQCETGFDEGEDIPTEVYEAIMALVPIVFNANQTTNRSDDAQKQYQTAADHAHMLLQPFVRTKGFTFRAA